MSNLINNYEKIKERMKHIPQSFYRSSNSILRRILQICVLKRNTNILKMLLDMSICNQKQIELINQTVKDIEKIKNNSDEIALLKSIDTYYFNSNINVAYLQKKEDVDCSDEKLQELISEFISVQSEAHFSEENRQELTHLALNHNLTYDLIRKFFELAEIKTPEVSCMDFSKYNLVSEKVSTFPTLIPFIDERNCELGKLNWIIKSFAAKNVYELNLLYQNIAVGKNVIFYTTGSIAAIIQHLIIIHSKKLSEDLHLSISESVKPNKHYIEKYQKVFSDFFNKYKNNIYILDNDFSESPNVDTLYKKLLQIDFFFLKNTGKNTDLIIIENIENMKFEYKNKIIKNPNIIIEKYIDFFIHNSNSFLGIDHSIPIVITTNHLLENSSNFLMFKPKLNINIGTYADLIIELLASDDIADNAEDLNVTLVSYKKEKINQKELSEYDKESLIIKNKGGEENGKT